MTVTRWMTGGGGGRGAWWGVEGRQLGYKRVATITNTSLSHGGPGTGEIYLKIKA